MLLELAKSSKEFRQVSRPQRTLRGVTGKPILLPSKSRHSELDGVGIFAWL